MLDLKKSISISNTSVLLRGTPSILTTSRLFGWLSRTIFQPNGRRGLFPGFGFPAGVRRGRSLHVSHQRLLDVPEHLLHALARFGARLEVQLLAVDAFKDGGLALCQSVGQMLLVLECGQFASFMSLHLQKLCGKRSDKDVKS